jgi:hypothetical protein
MVWKKTSFSDAAYHYTPASLKHAWAGLHMGDVEPWPADAALVQAWIAFHAGDFEQAAMRGLACGISGYSVANKASCIYANYLAGPEKFAMFQDVAEHCERQQAEQSGNPAAYFWHAYALGRYAQGISVLSALAQGLGVKVRDSLDKTLRIAPKHADAHMAFGTFQAEIVDKVGELIGALTYGVNKKNGYRHFKTALALHPASAIGCIEYAHALLMLEGKKKMADAIALYEAGAQCEAQDATERIEVEAAKKALTALH